MQELEERKQRQMQTAIKEAEERAKRERDNKFHKGHKVGCVVVYMDRMKIDLIMFQVKVYENMSSMIVIRTIIVQCYILHP